MRTINSLILLFSFLLFPNLQADTYTPEEGSVELKKRKKKSTTKIDPNLPFVLIIGDSISMGYTPFVKENLQGKANVIHAPGNSQGTTHGLKNLTDWLNDKKLGDKKWDVIHFNWGLHDLKHVKVAGTSENSNDFNDPQQADLPTYTSNMAKLVAQLKADGAKLIFATTTPYPAGVKPARAPENAAKYNDAALKIMTENNIEVNDLYSLVLPKLNTLQKPVNVHFHKEGSKMMGLQVSQAIEKHLTNSQ
ncbi:MAG: SGNH/GDSL hydrolase family protein [Lentisphaerales bacterium]|nr:SGNH/GDSL hydrolase family protein [Lentisphaerales bacterium]